MMWAGRMSSSPKSNNNGKNSNAPSVLNKKVKHVIKHQLTSSMQITTLSLYLTRRIVKTSAEPSQPSKSQSCDIIIILNQSNTWQSSLGFGKSSSNIGCYAKSRVFKI